MELKTRLERNTGPLRGQLPELIIFSMALLSLIYAVVTAPGKGIDLIAFRAGAREWVDGVFQIGAGPIGVYTPFLLPLLSPIALVSFDTLVVVWLALNIAATILSLYFVIELWGKQWPVKARLLLFACLIASAPFRVTVRTGQISLMVMALLLGALLSRAKKKDFLAGALLGLALCKYTLTFPFVLYFVWKREWRIVSATILITAALTEVFSLRLGLSIVEVISRHLSEGSNIYLSGTTFLMGTSDLKPLLLALTGERELLAATLTIGISLAALICMAIVFARRPRFEMAHFAAMALFALWAVYHRTYDSVLCLLPAALLVDFLVRKRFVAFSRFWLAALGLLILSIPGFLLDRLKLSPPNLSGNPLLFFGVHVERFLVFGMFWSLLFLMWKASDMGGPAESEMDNPIEGTVAPSHSLSSIPILPSASLRSEAALSIMWSASSSPAADAESSIRNLTSGPKWLARDLM